MSDAAARRFAIVKRYVPETDFHQNRYAALLERVVTSGCRWLDVGAGTMLHGGWVGTSQEVLAGRAHYLLGCDVVVKHLRINPFLGARVAAKVEQLPLPDSFLDLVTANMVVEHLESPRALFAEVCRVLRPGGRFVFLTPNRGHPVVFAAALLLTRRARRLLAHFVEHRALEHIFLTHYRANTPTAIRRLAEQAGLVEEQLEVFSSFPIFCSSNLLIHAQGLLISLARRNALSALRSNLLVSLRRPLAAPGASLS